MSIIAQNEFGWFICSNKYFDDIYKSCIDKNSSKCVLKFKKDLFNIKTPFVMKSEALKMSKNIKDPNISRASKKKRKKKKYDQDKSKSNSILSIDILIETSTKTLIELTHTVNYLDKTDISSKEWFENNIYACEAAKNIPGLSFNNETVLHFQNEYDMPFVTSFQGEDYVIPIGSSFYLCDVNHIRNLEEKQYDLILLDPPWENKSVKRKKGYGTLTLDLFADLPVERLCMPNCLVAVWVTNNKKQITFVKEELFKKWNVTLPVLWHWVKITQKGHYIHPIDSHHKKPYENLLLGRVTSKNNVELPKLKELKTHQTIVSIPSSIHSHKPPLVEILRPYLPEEPNCLEIFARYLLPKWTSIGNEVIKLQNTKLFDKLPDS